MCGLLIEVATRFKQTTTKKIRPNLKKQVFLGNTSGSGGKKKICYQVTVQMTICLPSRKLASLELLVVNTLTMQAMGVCVSLCVCKL